ncbi:Retrovirus-related Pol polyprotein from transposon 412 [Zootermopsis nevadensis]|uniref:Retrovirus-related Pol polyprotein from transposon 412 n=1 Tax=Zootermopsis nevadensis TaxID=136037 RepID=A0A067QT03_ZOONE|nr:Retrovirus-related Pol polyprotein from transposon 412 [Zootermopsis nevadensis]
MNVDRKNLLHENLRLTHIQDGAEKIKQICTEFIDIFKLPGDKLTATTAAENSIPTPPIPQGRAITLKNYRLPEAQSNEVQSQITKMLDEDIITPIKSEWNFPLIIVPKKIDASGKKN